MIVNLTLEEESRAKNQRSYRLVYNDEVYFLTVHFGKAFRNKIWECEKEIPEDIAPFITKVLKKELSESDAM